MTELRGFAPIFQIVPARHLPAMLRNARQAGRSRSGEFPNSGTRKRAGAKRIEFFCQ